MVIFKSLRVKFFTKERKYRIAIQNSAVIKRNKKAEFRLERNIFVIFLISRARTIKIS